MVINLKVISNEYTLTIHTYFADGFTSVGYKYILFFLPMLPIGDSLHFSVPFMNRLHQTKHATLSLLPFCAFFYDFFFLFYQISMISEM
jgi:hypothetical protein